MKDKNTLAKIAVLIFGIKTIVTVILTIIFIVLMARTFSAINNGEFSSLSPFAAEVEEHIEDNRASMEERKESGEVLQEQYDNNYQKFLELYEQHEQYHQDNQ